MEKKAAFNSKVLPYLLLAPSSLIILIFLFDPALKTFRLSAYRTDAFGFRKMFVGFDNFTELLVSPDYGKALVVTFFFTLWVVPIVYSLLDDCGSQGKKIWGRLVGGGESARYQLEPDPMAESAVMTSTDS